MSHQTPLDHTRAIADSITEHLKKTFPIKVGNKSLEIKSFDPIDLEAIDPRNYEAIAEAKAKDKTYGAPLYARLELREDGKLVDEKRVKLATVPAMAGDGTFIVQGSQFAVDKQLRLRPGIYTRIKQNGETEAHVNPDGFKNLRLNVDPATQKLTVNVNQANINAIPVLRILGIPDGDIKSALGASLYDANIKHIGKHGDEEIKRFFKSVNPKAEVPDSFADMSTQLSEELKKAKLDPKATKITLGASYNHLSGQAILQGLKKVVDVSRGTKEPDDRDALPFKTIHSAEDFVAERLHKNRKTIEFEITNKLRKSSKIGEILNSGHINKHVFSFFNSAALSEIPSQINPLAVINTHYKTTITGEGGIENSESIMPESQALHPTHYGFLDPINTPESKKIGVTLNLAVGTSKKGNDLFTEMINAKTGRTENVSAIDAYNHTIGLANEANHGMVAAIRRGKQVEVDAKEVTHRLPASHSAFTAASQALPLLHHDQGNRAGMASRHINQAISLVHREAPLVQVKSPIVPGMTAEEMFGKNHDISILAQEDGEISDITRSHIIYKGKSGETYKQPLFRHFDMQNKSYLHHEIDHLTPGMKFERGDVIADSNFTRGGTLALGTNMRVAYMPWKGLNFEDGIVVSESAAKKLTSNHLFQDQIEKDDEAIIASKKKFVAMYPTTYTKAQLNKLDEHGIAKPGVTLNPGDPYALILHKTQGTQEDLMLNRLHKSLVQPYKDASKTWDQLRPGLITKATINTKNIKVHGHYEAPATAGDKLALRHGNKGVITAIVPDAEMPTTKAGRVTEVILSPLGIPSRKSIGQLLENSASKVAEKTGKTYVVENFAPPGEQLKKVEAALKAHGLSDTEELIDPQTGKSYGHVMVGQPFVEKLFKTAKANVSARDTGAYDIDNKPVKGGEDGSKAVDQLTLYGLLSHGARGLANDVSTVKGDGNAQFWQNLENGLPLPKPQVPFVYKKFEALLNASGVNVRSDGSKKILTPLTDQQIHEMAGKNELHNFEMLNHKLEPIKGGLFDPSLTGGSNGQKWSKVTLAHPIANPMYAGAIKTLLDMSDVQFNHAIGEENGHDKIKGMLSNIDVRTDIDALTDKLKTAPKTHADKIVKKLKVLKALDSLNMKPDEAYITSVVPIVPPQFRPVFEIPGGHIQTHSLNSLYRDFGAINTTIKELGATPGLSKALYESVGAIQGLTKPQSKQNESRDVKGAMQIIIGGGSPKYGFFQNKVLRKQQDLSGRATAVLSNTLGMDQIAIPEKIAKVIYKPFAVKALLNHGYSHKEATDHIDEFTAIGKKAVQAAMADRPVLMNRAPSLHKFSIMAFQPTLTKGLSIEVPGLIVKPYSLDFDGDTTVLHVPATEKARKEAFSLMPSKNLYNPRSRELNYTLDQEAVIGLHLLSNKEGGVAKINDILPSDVKKMGANLTKNDINNALAEVAEKHPDNYADLATKLKVLGDNAGTDLGFTLSLKDLKDHSHLVKQEFAPALKILHSGASHQKKVDALLAADKAVKGHALNIKDNGFVTIAASGAKGSSEEVKQIMLAPGILSDHNGNAIMRPVLGSYAQGLTFADYWTTLYGARKGSLDKQLMTAKPGALNKEIVNTTMNIVTSSHDCGTKHGIPMRTSDPHLVGRYLADGTLISKSNLDSIRSNHDSVIIRSPATCESAHGICQKCYGIDEFGALPKIGDNVGIKAAQSMSEPLTQAAMKTFHLGGTASGGGGVFGGFEHVANFLQAPETFKNKATMASIDGTVTDIKEGAAGGWHVTIGNKNHFVNPKSGELFVKKGDHVKVGDLLNNGVPHPKDAIKLLGEIDGIHKITDSLHKIYKDSKIGMDRRNVETVVRGMTGFGIIQDAGTHEHFVKGDVVPLSAISSFNQTAGKSKEVALKDAYGMHLSQEVGHFKSGTRVGNKMIDALAGKHSKVQVEHAPISYERTAIGVQQAPLKNQDWMARLGYRYLKRGLQEGATYGYESDLHGHNPIAAFVTGQMGDPDMHGHY